MQKTEIPEETSQAPDWKFDKMKSSASIAALSSAVLFDFFPVPRQPALVLIVSTGPKMDSAIIPELY